VLPSLQDAPVQRREVEPGVDRFVCRHRRSSSSAFPPKSRGLPNGEARPFGAGTRPRCCPAVPPRVAADLAVHGRSSRADTRSRCHGRTRPRLLIRSAPPVVIRGAVRRTFGRRLGEDVLRGRPPGSHRPRLAPGRRIRRTRSRRRLCRHATGTPWARSPFSGDVLRRPAERP
jgi:hypothetical protein